MSIETDDFRVLTEEKFLGPVARWRRFGKPVPAGASIGEDGKPDNGLFGPGSMAWTIMLHPATIVFESIAQSLLQLTYKPIAAGIRDHDPLSRKARAGTLTYFDAFERFQRNAGMHAPMWLGDTATARSMAQHLTRVHDRVKGDVIDIGSPELGGYAASGPRDAMWAALTEIDAMLHLYENMAWHGDEPPRRLSDEDRDRYYAEAAAYLRLVGAPEDEIPTTAAEVDALYERYDAFFGHTETLDVIPETGQDYKQLSDEVMRRNFHPSQVPAVEMLKKQFVQMRQPVLGALPERTRRHAGLDAAGSTAAVKALADAMPMLREMQQPEKERETMRLMWGPDAVILIEEARERHFAALAAKAD